MVKNKKRLYFTLISILVLFFVSLLIDEYKENKWRANKHKKYTIATITKFKPGKATLLYYKFKINSKIYNGNQSIISETRSEFDLLNSKEIVGKRFFIICMTNDLDFNNLLLDKPVPDSTQNAPKNGWKKLPID